MNTLYNIDCNILLFIQDNIRNDALSSFFKTITHLGDHGILFLLVAIVLCMTPRERRTGIALSIGLLLQLIFINGILKNVVRRPRPYDEIDLLTSLIGKMPDSSFPSGHTTASFLSATIIYMCMKDKRYGIMAYIIAILIALSRLYLGVHYPSDVIAGVIFGVIIGFVVSKIASLHKKSRKH